MPTLLAIDDDPLILKSFELAVTGEGITVRSAMTAGEGVYDFTENRPDVVICDVRLPDRSGLDLLADLQKVDPKVPVILMTGYGTAETAIEAMRRGAFDYLLKPFEPDPLIELLVKAMDVSRLMRVPPRVSAEAAEESGEELFVGQSAAMQDVFKTIGRVAPTDATTLILGESGTGKELVARAIYHYSRRVEKPFLAINCAAIPETLLESELFGHEKGSFTGADRKRDRQVRAMPRRHALPRRNRRHDAADTGENPARLTGGSFERVGGNTAVETDVRVIAATSRNLEAMIAAGTFREDLYYRLNVCMIRLPPLRERREDIPILVQHFLRLSACEFDKSVKNIAPDAMAALENYAWPGNVRQLQSVVKQSLLRVHGPVLTLDALPAEVKGGAATSSTALVAEANELIGFIRDRLQSGTTCLYAEVLDRVERVLLTEVLAFAKGNLTQTAAILGITRPTLRSKLHHLGIRVDSHAQITQQS